MEHIRMFDFFCMNISQSNVFVLKDTNSPLILSGPVVFWLFVLFLPLNIAEVHAICSSEYLQHLWTTAWKSRQEEVNWHFILHAVTTRILILGPQELHYDMQLINIWCIVILFSLLAALVNAAHKNHTYVSACACKHAEINTNINKITYKV